MPKQPPKEWWDSHYKEVKEGNPSYSDEQVRKTVGDIWYHKMSPSKKKEETKKSEGSLRVESQISSAQSVEACVSKMKLDQQINAYGVAQKQGIEPITAEQELNKLVDQGILYKDDSWYGLNPDHPTVMEWQKYKEEQLERAQMSIQRLRNQGSLRVTAASTLVEGMARAFWATAWADKMEEHGLSSHMSGMEITEIMPEVPPKAYMLAEDLKKTIESTNNVNLDEFRPPGADTKQQTIEEGQKYLESWTSDDERDFGWYLAMESMGHGVSWADNHEDHGLKLPLIENYELWDDADDAIDAEYGMEHTHEGSVRVEAQTGKKRITIDNLDHKDGMVSVYASIEDAKSDQSIQGSRWEIYADFAFTIITDKPGLVQELEAEGYEVNADEYYAWKDWDELKSMMDEKELAVWEHKSSIRIDALPAKKWMGSPPEECDICHMPLADQPWWVDGATGMGPWANMCPKCFSQYGVGLGLGRGQKYDMRTLEKIEGAMRIEAQTAFPNLFSSEAKRWIVTETKRRAAEKARAAGSPEQVVALIEQSAQEVAGQLSQAVATEITALLNDDTKQKIFDEIAAPQEEKQPVPPQIAPPVVPAPGAVPPAPAAAPATEEEEEGAEATASSKVPMARSLRVAFGHNAGFMEPQIVQGTWIMIDGPQGTEWIEGDTVDENEIRALMARIDAGEQINLRETSLADYTENETAFSIDIQNGFGARLSAPGYLDRTDWTVFDTAEEAEAYLNDTYGAEEKPAIGY